MSPMTRALAMAVCGVSMVHAYGSSAEDRAYYGAGCTALALGKGATHDGSTMVSHGNDCPNCDFRLAWVPAKDHPKGSKRPIYMAKNDYPRVVREDTAEVYKKENLETGFDFTWEDTEPMGYVDEVEHTYAYLDGAYGIQNEYQLSIGESTCDARLADYGRPISQGGQALLDIAALSRIALERCKTARCAITTMGALAQEHGFYGGQTPDWDPAPAVFDEGEGGEALTIADPHETWVFEICPDDSHKGAVWVAQRVPDDEVTVVTNTFNIGQIDLGNPDFFMASDNIYDVATRMGFWSRDSGVPFDFTQIYRGTKGHSLPSGLVLTDRRKWEVFNLIAPSMNFDPYHAHAGDDSDLYFPFSVKPDHKLTEEEVFRIHRDVFQNTPFDMEMDVVAGPWGDPFRAKIPVEHPFNDTEVWKGGFERAVSQLWTSYTTITQSRWWLPDAVGGRTWFGPHDAMTTLFSPIYPGAAKHTGYLPETYSVGSLLKVNTKSIWWAVTTQANYAARFYSYTLVNISDSQRAVEGKFLHMASAAEKEAVTLSGDAVGKRMAQLQDEIATTAIQEWWDAFFNMVGNFHDGSFFTPGVVTKVTGSVKYPAWWLKYIGPEGTHMAEWANSHPSKLLQHSADRPNSPMNALQTTPKQHEDSSLLSHPVVVSSTSIVLGLLLRPILDHFARKEGYDALP